MRTGNIGIAIMLLCLWSFPLSAQQRSVEVLPQGDIQIQVATNVSDFSCLAEGSDIQHLLKVEQVEGEFGFEYQNFTIPLAVKSFDCGPRLRTAEFRDILQADEFPNIFFTIKEIRTNEGDSDEHVAWIEVAMLKKQVQRWVKLKITRDILGTSNITGTCQLKFSDFGIAPPVKAMGLVKVEDELSVDLNLFLNGLDLSSQEFLVDAASK